MSISIEHVDDVPADASSGSCNGNLHDDSPSSEAQPCASAYTTILANADALCELDQYGWC
jgi:hypothetical protein